MKRALPYPTRQARIDILGHYFELLEVADSEALLDELIGKGETHEDVIDERIPYWAELWPSALGLAQFLLRHRPLDPGQQVLELGCGLGLPGIVAGKLGAVVTLSDYLEPALAFAQNNWQLNHHQPVKLAVLDWRKPDPALAADCLLASDITYEARNFPFLPNAFRTLCRPSGKIIVSDPRRQVARHFFKDLPRDGFSVEEFEETVLFQGNDITIHIYQISRDLTGG
jgi:predicted nicotinamide N-methyase